MRILAVTPYFGPEGGGLERYAEATLTRLAARGHEVEVLCCTRQEARQDEVQGVRVVRRRPALVLGNTPIDPRFRGAVRERIRNKRPDVVLAHTPVPFPAEMAYLAARQAGVPFVTTYHAGKLAGSSPLLEGFAALDRWTLERMMLGGSARLIAVTDFVREHVLASHRDKVEVIPPGVDAARYRPGRGDDRTILFVGPLSRSYRWKGLDVLLEAYPLVRSRVPEARMVLVGDGDRVPELRRWAEAVDGEVEVRGRLSEDRLVEAYREAAVVTLPSITEAESFGMVLAEANACGRPVVGSRIGGIPCFVRDGENGHLATPGDAQDLADKLVSLLLDRQAADAMGAKGRQRVVKEHDWDRLTAATEAVLESVVSGPIRRSTGQAEPRSASSAPDASLQRRLA